MPLLKCISTLLLQPSVSPTTSVSPPSLPPSTDDTVMCYPGEVGLSSTIVLLLVMIIGLVFYVRRLRRQYLQLQALYCLHKLNLTQPPYADRISCVIGWLKQQKNIPYCRTFLKF